MDPSSVMLSAFEMVRCNKPTWWRLFALVVTNDQGAEAGTLLSEREAAEWTGMSRNSVEAGFGQLVELRVLLRHDGGGPRAHAYRVNPDFRDWRVDWQPGRDVALFRIHRLLHPELGRKPRTAAHPVGALTTTVARPPARLWDASRAPGCATVGPLVARVSARLERAERASHTSSSNWEPQSVSDGPTDGPMQVLAAIYQQVGEPVFGRYEREVRDLVDGHDPAELVAAIRARPGLKITGYIAQLRQHLAAGELTPAAPAGPTVEPWKPPDYSDAVPPPADLGDWLRRDTVAAACDDGDGGAAP